MKSKPSLAASLLDAAQLARARSHSYELLGRLFLEGVTTELLPYLETVPELAVALPRPFDADEAAAAHHDLFAFHLFPYASIFLDDSGLLGGEISNQTGQLYQQAGFPLQASTASPDHVGYELAFLGYLLAAEANARQTQPNAAQLWQNQQHHFLEDSLLPWLFPFLVALEQAAVPFYQKLAQLTLALVGDHHTQLMAQIESERLPVHSEGSDLLADPQTGLRDIAQYLTTPRQSGLYIGRHDIRRLARQLALSHGFGGREQMLLNLLRMAAQYEKSYELLQLIEETAKQWQLAYQRIHEANPGTAVFLHPWQVRLNHTRHLLEQMKIRVINVLSASSA